MCDADDDVKREFSRPDVRFTQGWTRREFVMSALATATGLALAMPAWAQMITTDAQGLTAGDVRIPRGLTSTSPRIARCRRPAAVFRSC